MIQKVFVVGYISITEAQSQNSFGIHGMDLINNGPTNLICNASISFLYFSCSASYVALSGRPVRAPAALTSSSTLDTGVAVPLAVGDLPALGVDPEPFAALFALPFAAGLAFGAILSRGR